MKSISVVLLLPLLFINLLLAVYVYNNGCFSEKVDFMQSKRFFVRGAIIDERWSPIYYESEGEIPVVIVGPPTYQGSDPGAVQVRHTSTHGAEIRFAEWEYLDGNHANENITYVAFPQGRHDMPDGSIWEVGTVDISRDRSIVTWRFSESFVETPTLILTPQTANDCTTYSVRAKNVSSAGFQLTLNEQESSTGTAHVTETVGYVAIYSANKPGTAEFNAVPFEYNLLRETLTHEWKNIAGYSLKVEEEQSQDIEITHTTETIDVLLINGFLFAQDVVSKGSDTSALRRNTLQSPAMNKSN